MAYTSVPNNSFPKLKNLSGKTIYVYLLLRKKLKYRPNQKDKLIPVSDIISFTYQEAEGCGVSNKTFSRSIEKLVQTGLVRITKKGKRGYGRNPTLYQIF